MSKLRQVIPFLIAHFSNRGLTLAHTLRLKNIDFEIFDKCLANILRDENWPLTLHSMLPDLRRILQSNGSSFDSISVCAGTRQPDEYAFYNGYTRELQNAGNASDLDFIHANRDRLINCLERGLNIRWGKAYERHQVVGNVVTAFFKDGTCAQGNVLIGCDGVHSRGTQVYTYYIFRINRISLSARHYISACSSAAERNPDGCYRWYSCAQPSSIRSPEQHITFRLHRQRESISPPSRAQIICPRFFIGRVLLASLLRG